MSRLDYLGTIVDIEECAKQTGRIAACLADTLDEAMAMLSYQDMPTHAIEWFVVGFEEKRSERCLQFAV